LEYTDLDVWTESRKLVKEIYNLTKSYPKDEMYTLISQMRLSAVSIPSNIAEGCGRRTSTDTMQFLHIARGSLYELETQLFLSLDQEYLSLENFKSSIEQIKTCKKLLNGFINYYAAK